MPSYVIVWENNTIGHKKVSECSWPGHSAINVGKEFWVDEYECRAAGNYVSWWPEDSASFDAVGALFSKKQKGSISLSLISDVCSEGYLPDHVIEMQTDKKLEDDMIAEWKSVWTKDGASYRTLRKNCSTICSRVLHAGGFYAKKWAVDCNFAWSPADIRKLAVSAGGTMLKWNAFVEKVLKASFVYPNQFKNWKDLTVDHARSGRFCSTGAPCKYQPDETWRGGK